MITKTKAIVPNQCWLVETDGKKIGTLYKEVQGFSFYSGGNKIILDNSLRVNQHLTISISEPAEITTTEISKNFVHGYPTSTYPFNPVYSIQKKLPIYTATNNSKSKICAGFYLILENEKWKKYFCPKLIKLDRCKFYGPFKTDTEMIQKLEHISNEAN